MDTQAMSIRATKSAKLTDQEWKALKKFRKQFDTEVACAIAIGVDRLVLNRVLLIGSASPRTIEQIRKVLPVTE